MRQIEVVSGTAGHCPDLTDLSASYKEPIDGVVLKQVCAACMQQSVMPGDELGCSWDQVLRVLLLPLRMRAACLDIAFPYIQHT